MDRQSLWDDEVATLQTIHTPLPQLITRHATYECHPPLYFLQLRLWKKIFGDSLGALRANSAWWGTCALAIFYLLARGYGFGLLALTLMTFSPLHVAYSQELRPYALGIFLALASWWSMEKIVGVRLGPIVANNPSPLVGEGGRRPDEGSTAVKNLPLTPTLSHVGERGFLLQVLLWTCLLYTHYWGAFVCTAQAVYALCLAPSMKDRLKVMGSGIIAVALFSFWWPVLHAQLEVVNAFSFWVPPASVLNLGKTFIAYTGVYFKVASSAFQMPGPRWFLGGVAAVYGALAVWGWKTSPRLARYWLGLGLLLPWVLSYASHGLYVWYRYPVLMWPAFILLVSAGLLRLRWAALRGILIGLFVGAQLAGLWRYFSGWQKANPKAVAAFVDGVARPGMIVVRPAYFSYLYHYYDRGRTTVVDTAALDSREKRAALRGHLIVLIAFDVPNDPIKDAFLVEYSVLGRRYFPGFAHLGITVYTLK